MTVLIERALEWIKLKQRDSNGRYRIAVTHEYGGEQWTETGYIGRSTGRTPINLLVHNRRSYGGGPLNESSIVRIEWANKKRDGAGIIWER